MSFRVMVIPEDPTYNGYILKPLVERIMKEAGKPKASVTVLTNPSVSGFEYAKKELENIFERYPGYNLFLFLPDRDGSETRDHSLNDISKKYQGQHKPFIAKAAVEEVETWLLAGHKDSLAQSWRQIRQDASVKENVFEPFLINYGDSSPGEGRERLMKHTLKNFSGLLQSCPEIKELVEEIKKLVSMKTSP